ncbi:hypothetical protein B0H16DRAFT_1456055 [Mycena metata]|uniref:Uncharacterized protein n=1 Tax=Mycena metata TaxID=1033252 RepID=A0AAD7JD40_9AGAR|nr:hypothetical protein B0H16DRAFT_1456055 [Mycena metata]
MSLSRGNPDLGGIHGNDAASCRLSRGLLPGLRITVAIGRAVNGVGGDGSASIARGSEREDGRREAVVVVGGKRQAWEQAAGRTVARQGVWQHCLALSEHRTPAFTSSLFTSSLRSIRGVPLVVRKFIRSLLPAKFGILTEHLCRTKQQMSRPPPSYLDPTSCGSSIPLKWDRGHACPYYCYSQRQYRRSSSMTNYQAVKN